MTFAKGDRVKITGGKYAGRTGAVHRLCVLVTDHIRITLDLKGRERVQNTVMVELKLVEHETTSDFLNQNKLTMAETAERVLQKMVPLPKITIGKSNPRKAFDEDAIKELTESIKHKGVLQAILLRFTAADGVYELVCGERRYRACQAAGLNQIPAVIREMSDDEALEAQITENLQRKDVHPLEEAVAFKQLLDHHNNNVEEVAAKVGKKEYYVNQRMKFNDLLPEWQKVFYKNLLSIGDALKIAMLPANSQKELLEDQEVDDNTVEKGVAIKINDWTFRKMKGKLKDAPFDITDATLDKKIGACTGCKFNSAFANLFPEDAANPVCSDLHCFKNKTNLHFDREVKVALQDPAIILVSDNWNVDKKVVDRYKKEGHEVLNNNNYSSIENDEEEPIWEEYKEEYADDYDTAAELREAFEDESRSWKEDQELYQKKVASGKYLKAFVVEGNNTGKYIYIEMKKKGQQSQSAASKVDPTEASIAGIDDEISRIREKQKRAKELDGEKVHKQIIDALDKDKALKTLPTAFTDVDWAFVCFLIAEHINYSSKDIIKKVVGISLGSWSETKCDKLFLQLKDLSDEQLAFIARTIIFQKFNQSSPNYNGGYMVRKLAELLGTIPIEAFEQEQLEKAAKRQKNVDKRISELQEQKKLLKPKPAAKKATAKK